jgi:hypothetical protein
MECVYCAVRTGCVNIFEVNFHFLKLVSSLLRLSLAGFSPQSSGFDPRPVHVTFVVEKMALGRVFSSLRRLSPVSITVIPCQYHGYPLSVSRLSPVSITVIPCQYHGYPLSISRFSPVSIMPSMLHTNLHLQLTLTRTRRILGTIR